MALARADDLILLYGTDRKTFIVRLTPGERVQTHRGILLHDDLIGTPYGNVVRTHLNHRYFLLTPSTNDIIRDLKRSGQIIFPKDLGYILMKMSITTGCQVIEAGTGSGALTIALAQAVRPTGRVISYDVREDMQHLAAKNLARLGLSDGVTLKLRDIATGFDENDMDALFLDVPNPWDYLGQVHAALRGGGFLGSLVPTANQVIDLLGPLMKGPYIMVEVEEVLVRGYKVVPERFRPLDRMIAHTGYLIFARTVSHIDREFAGEAAVAAEVPEAEEVEE